MSGVRPARRLADALIGLYPLAWRARYGDEVGALLDEHRVSLETLIDLSRGALDAHRHPEFLRRDFEAMAQDPTTEKTFTRRQVLLAAGGSAIGVAAVAVIGFELEQKNGPSGTAVASGNPSSPSSSPLLLAEATSSPSASAATTAAPAAPTPAPTPAGARSAFRTRTDLTPPVITVVTPAASTVAPGLIFYTPADGATPDGLAIVDNAGELIWSRPDNGVDAANFGVSQYQGKPVLSWWEGANNNGIGNGALVIADASYKEITRVQVADGRKADLHEFQITPTGTALFFADQGVAANDPATGKPLPYEILDCEIQEVDIATGKLLWSWHTVDHITMDETYIAPPTKSNQIFDYVHANALELDTDGNLIMSARNTCAIYKIDKSTGAITWRLGGRKSDFAMGDGTPFSWQHDVRRQADGTLTIFDDGNTNSVVPGAPGAPAASSATAAPATPAPTAATVQHPSRGIVLRLDETAKTATLVKAYPHPKPLLATSQGNVQVLPNGNVFVGWGSTPWYTEFGSDGSVLYDATFPAAIQSYRNFRFPWVGQPSDAPAVAVRAGTGGTAAVFASWNGATEVASWDVLSGDTAASLATIGTGPRTGFETSIPVSGVKALVAVQAKDASGKVLGTSAPISTTA